MNALAPIFSIHDARAINEARALADRATLFANATSTAGGRYSALVEAAWLQLLAEVIKQTNGDPLAAFHDACQEAGIDTEGYPLDPKTGDRIEGADKLIVMP